MPTEPPETTKRILEEVKAYYRDGDMDIKDVRRFLFDRLDVKKSQIYRYTDRIAAEVEAEGDRRELQDGEIAFAKSYAYNTETGDYVFFTDKLLGKKIILKDHKVQEMLKRYSRFDGDMSTINEIGSSFGLSRATVVFIMRALGFTHDTLPVTDEELLENDPDQLIESVLAEKKYTLNREYEKRSWKMTNIEAKKWRNFEQRVLNPFAEFVEQFQYRKPAFKFKANPNKPDSCFLVGISDTHFGANSDGRQFYGSEWNIEKAEECYMRYVNEFYDMCEERAGKNKQLLKLLCFGDIVHGLKGETEKGTRIEAFPLGTDQIEVPFRCLDRQIELGLELGFQQIQVEAVTGNHSHFGDWALYKLIETAYRDDERVTVNIANDRWNAFTVADSLFIMEHGYSPFYKSKVPSGKDREIYIQKLLINVADLLAKTKNRYFLTADQHSFVYQDAGGFEFIRFGTLVTGDNYASQNNLNSRPRQTVLEVDKTGIKATHNFYFD